METTNERQQEQPGVAVPQEEHEWLRKLVGEWTYEAEAEMTPGEPADKFAGTESVRSIGGLWFQAEGRGEMPGGGAATTVMTLGYDPERGRYVGTFIASMMTHMWIYEGELDADGNALALRTEGPSMAGDGKTAQYREVIRFESDDHRVFTSDMLKDDGTTQHMMTAHYRRKGRKG